MDPAGDAANGGGTCDVAVDNKAVDDVTMDTGGDYSSSLEKVANEILNDKEDESDNAADNKDKVDFDKNIEDENDAEMKDSGDVTDDDVDSNEAKEEHSNDEEDMESQVEDSNKVNSADQNIVVQNEESNGNSQDYIDSADPDETAESFITATEESLFDNINETECNDDGSQEEVDYRLLDETESSVHMEPEMEQNDDTERTEEAGGDGEEEVGEEQDEDEGGLENAAAEAEIRESTEQSGDVMEDEDALGDVIEKDDASPGGDGLIENEDDSQGGDEQTGDVIENEDAFPGSDEQSCDLMDEAAFHGGNEQTGDVIDEDASPGDGEQSVGGIEDEDAPIGKEDGDSLDDNVEELVTTPDEQDTVDDKEELVQESQQSPQVDDTVEKEADVFDTEDSNTQDTDTKEEVREPEFSSSDFLEKLDDASDTLDSIAKSTDSNTKDDAFLDTESSEMTEMKTLYDTEEKSDNLLGSNMGEDSCDIEAARDESSCDTSESVKDTGTVDDSEETEVNATESNIEMEAAINSASKDYGTAQDVEQMEVDDTDVQHNEADTDEVCLIQSEIPKDLAEKVGESSKGDDISTEQINEESDINSGEEKDTVTLDRHEATDETYKPKSPEKISDDGKAGEEGESENSSGHHKDTNQEVTEADEAKLLETTEGEKEAEEREEAMETDDKTEEDAGAKQVETEKEPHKDSTTEAEGKTEKSSEEGKIADDMLKKEVSEEKVKKEEIPEVESQLDENVDQSENTTGVKIVGVTSAVGMEDAKPVTEDEKEVIDEDKKTIKAGSPVLIDDEDDKSAVKEEKKVKPSQGRTTRSSSAAGVKKEQEEKAKTVKQESNDKDDDVIAIKEEKKPVQKPKSGSKIQKCIVCQKVGKCKYNIVRNGDVKHLCDDVCFKKFRSNPTEYLRQSAPAAPSAAKTENKTSPPAPPASQNIQKSAPSAAPPPVYKTCSVCQLMNVRTSKPFLSWQGLDFCGEECLGKFQGGLSATCSYCASQINQVNRAKFCWRVGTEVKQFCSSPCYSEFVKRLKLCAFCNKDLANMRDSFMAPVGTQGTFKDFCSQICLAKYEERNSKDIQIVGVERGQKTSTAPKGNFTCAVCGKTGPVKHEIRLEGKNNRLCSDPCLSAFQYANKLTMNTCDNCGTNCYNENTSPQYIQYEGQQKRFCSYMCVNSFKNFNKKTVPCAWCGTKKSNFDMIERVDANNKYQLFCSLNCLSLYRVNLQATSNQAVVCDQCRKYVPAQYHLTMSDASVRNFCSYTCVMQFQAQFTTPKQQQTNSAPPKQQMAQPPTGQQPVTTTRSGRPVYNTRGGRQQQAPQPPAPQAPTAVAQPKQSARQMAAAQKKGNAGGQTIPIISNVVSLAPQGNQQQINVKSSTPVVVQGQQEGIKTTTTTAGNQTVQQQIIIQPPPPKTVKNKSLLCKPYVQTKATSCKPHTQTKEIQTEGKAEPDKYLIPVPVPVYVPTPLAMYSTPTPVMIPVPVPIPVPVFIPTTKKSSGSILKQIKEIQERIPNDPLEAELLMMAEAVAGKDDESSSESEEEQPEALPVVVSKEPAAPPPSGGELGEDMLQMALRMASEMSDEPVMDLENSLEPVAVSSVPPPQVTPASAVPMVEEEDDDTDEYIPPASRNSRRSQGGRKRAASSRRGRSSKRQKIELPSEINPQRETTPSPPTAPPPDANFHLKYTYGVNAWKHWVVAKNSQLESATRTGVSKKLKMFKTDILQCTADELNYALCLFVKEVRKPNGEEYAVDSIYYLCLGIQQYLFENGRIDNIFTDIYFEKFTEFLNEVLTMYEPKLNTAGQLVCRIEEEHLWESKQLGAHSPHVLLNSLVYFNTKYFMLKTSEDHLKLSFTHIMKHWKKTASGKGSGTGVNVGRSVYLRYYCPNLQGKSDPNQKKRKEEMPVYEQTENLDNPLRCPVKLYEFYLSKCPESIKNKNDTFYLVPERSCVPDSPVWYSTSSLGIDSMAKMLNRIRLVREIQEAHLHTQPVYI